ncbi:ATP-binding protein [Bradyrhizobium sp. SZCCHNPS1003]|uniref:ATP-binding protein n=1 Tax=Bradyrhizobium sp. SZCCHNPS1003 TaxID=3057330 RepID=UPI0028F05529|nr:ATP-binding protein [Bradyrhizobium sp. SZCCHNPS1003]
MSERVAMSAWFSSRLGLPGGLSRAWPAIAAIAVLAIVGVALLSYRLALSAGLAQMSRDSDDRLTLIASTFDATVARFRYLPTVLSLADPVRRLFRTPGDGAVVEAANRYLKSLNQAAGSAELYVLDTAGVTLAASNYDGAKSFVGHAYDFRPYFQSAIRDGEGQLYAVGVTTGLPGYFLSQRITEGELTIGVAVVKIDLTPLEADWVRAGDLVAMEDEEGVLILASRAQWKYHPLRRLPSTAVARLNASRQFGDTIENAPILGSSAESGEVSVELGDDDGVHEYALRARPLPAHGWQLLIFSDIGEARRHAMTIAVTAGFAVLTVQLLGLVAHQWRQSMKAKGEANELLERSVAERTMELREANRQLTSEVLERTRTEQELRQTHESLVQSAKLASLGQALAGVAHEINQPLAALTTYIASSRVLLQRNEIERTALNLDLMSSIAERMMALIGHLRMFARKETGATSRVDVGVTLGNAMRLLQYRIRNEGIEVVLDLPAEPAHVEANPIRLEQVFVNLLSNAVQSMRDRPRRVLTVSIRRAGSTVTTEVADTGSGISADHMKSLFDPFFTTKEIGEGLGLGLSISYGIVRELGGTISVESELQIGSRFRVTLPTPPEPA